MSSVIRRREELRKRELGNESHHSLHRFRVGRVRLVANTKTRTRFVMFPNQANIIQNTTHNQSEKELNASPPCHEVLKYITPSLITLLALKYNGMTESPFETHSANIWAFLIATFIYSLALVLLKETQLLKKLLNLVLLLCHSNQTIGSLESWAVFLGYVVGISGAFSLVSLVSIFITHILGRLILWAFLPIVLAGVLFKWVLDKFNSARRNLIMEQPSLPTTSSPV